MKDSASKESKIVKQLMHAVDNILTHRWQLFWTRLPRRVTEVFWKIHRSLSKAVMCVVAFGVILMEGKRRQKLYTVFKKIYPTNFCM